MVEVMERANESPEPTYREVNPVTKHVQERDEHPAVIEVTTQSNGSSVFSLSPVVEREPGKVETIREQELSSQDTFSVPPFTTSTSVFCAASSVQPLVGTLPVVCRTEPDPISVNTCTGTVSCGTEHTTASMSKADSGSTSYSPSVENVPIVCSAESTLSLGTEHFDSTSSQGISAHSVTNIQCTLVETVAVTSMAKCQSPSSETFSVNSNRTSDYPSDNNVQLSSMSTGRSTLDQMWICINQKIAFKFPWR